MDHRHPPRRTAACGRWSAARPPLPRSCCRFRALGRGSPSADRLVPGFQTRCTMRLMRLPGSAEAGVAVSCCSESLTTRMDRVGRMGRPGPVQGGSRAGAELPALVVMRTCPVRIHRSRHCGGSRAHRGHRCYLSCSRARLCPMLVQRALVAPSDMMDGGSARFARALDNAGFPRSRSSIREVRLGVLGPSVRPRNRRRSSATAAYKDPRTPDRCGEVRSTLSQARHDHGERRVRTRHRRA